MGFADITIADIATEYRLSAEDVGKICDRLGVKYKDRHTCLALEDAKAVMLAIIGDRQGQPAE